MLALVIVPRPAGAIVLVEDIPAITQQIKSLAQDLKAYEVYVQQLQQAVQQVEWASSTFESLVAHPSLPSAMAAMGMAGIENPLPVSPYAVQGLISGYGGAGGLSAITSRLGALGGLVNSSYSANHIYTPTDNTYASQQLQNGATGVAGAQGIAQSIMQQMAARFPVLQALRNDMLSATTPAERESVMGQIAAEQAWASNAQGQLQNAQFMMVAEVENRKQRDDEQEAKSLDGQLAQARAEGIIQ
jgi:hypothetical protein